MRPRRQIPLGVAIPRKRRLLHITAWSTIPPNFRADQLSDQNLSVTHRVTPTHPLVQLCQHSAAGLPHRENPSIPPETSSTWSTNRPTNLHLRAWLLTLEPQKLSLADLENSPRPSVEFLTDDFFFFFVNGLRKTRTTFKVS